MGWTHLSSWVTRAVNLSDSDLWLLSLDFLVIWPCFLHFFLYFFTVLWCLVLVGFMLDEAFNIFSRSLPCMLCTLWLNLDYIPVFIMVKPSKILLMITPIQIHTFQKYQIQIASALNGISYHLFPFFYIILTVKLFYCLIVPCGLGCFPF